jgi:hypothetical protein
VCVCVCVFGAGSLAALSGMIEMSDMNLKYNLLNGACIISWFVHVYLFCLCSRWLACCTSGVFARACVCRNPGALVGNDKD